MIPVGGIELWVGADTPAGHLPCDGSAVSRVDYADLFAVIGETYGPGDGVDTFNVPDLTGKVPAMGTPGDETGQEQVVLTDGQLHEHNHAVNMAAQANHGHTGGSFSGASFSTGVSGNVGSAGAHAHSYNGNTTTQKNLDGGGGAGANMWFTDTGARTNTTGAHTHTMTGSASASVSGGNVNINASGAYTPTILSLIHI